MAVRSRSLFRTSWLALLLAAAGTPASEWPQYRGPAHDGSSPETGILSAWPAEGPRQAWKVPMGEGFGSFAVAGGSAYCFAERDKVEALVALDAATGKERWVTALGTTIFEGAGGNGPRSTPAVDGDRVYVLGTWFLLSCLSTRDGKVLWQHDLAKDFAGQVDTRGIKQWGNAASPVVDGDLVYVAGGGPGQALLAFAKSDGKLAWKTQDDQVTHATAVPATIGGVRQVVFLTQQGLAAVDAKGAVLWRHPFPFKTSTAASPIISGDIVYCSAGYGVGAGACKVVKKGSGFTATELWRTPDKNPNHWSTPVHHDGYLYGLYGFKELGSCPLKCIELATGKEMWSEPGFGQGGNILVDGKLLVQGDRGQLVLVEPSPKAYKEVARAQVLGGKCWTMPVVAGGFAFCRSTKEAVCLDLRAKAK